MNATVTSMMMPAGMIAMSAGMKLSEKMTA
jgi:hypothetical protein